MALVYYEDFKELFFDACAKINIDEKRFDYAFFEILEEEINKKLNHLKIPHLKSLKATYLLSKVYYAIRDMDSEIGKDISYSTRTLNSFCYFVHGVPWKEKFKFVEANTRTEDVNESETYSIFPLKNPSFPASPTIPYFNIAGFDKIYLKDESFNPTGTHKDRLAYEIAMHYKEIRPRKKLVFQGSPKLSLITSGGAGIAIQSVLTHFNTKLNVLLDEGIKKRELYFDEKLKRKIIGADIINALKNAGSNIFFADFKKKLNSDEICELTDNHDGFDLTFAEDIEYIKENYYDFLAYEIINQSPDYIFLPFGSGDLMRGLLSIIKKEKEFTKPSKRMFVRRKGLNNIKVYGATTFNPNSKMDKLYSSVFSDNENKVICEKIIDEGYVYNKTNPADFDRASGIVGVEEEFVEKAYKVAADFSINCEPSGIAGLALLMQLKEDGEIDIPKDKKILVVNTGRLKLEKFGIT